MSFSFLVPSLGSTTATFSDFEEQVKDSELMYVLSEIPYKAKYVFVILLNSCTIQLSK